MFYSHEILTSRQHGVATVWLVATLGSRSTLKKVTRKAILDVDVAKACDTIRDPTAPMALRLQGNLLFGVSRVYSQQCDYVLSDTQNFRDKMKGVVVVMRELEIDPEAGKVRPDQLILPDDPSFLPDLDMNLDLSMFDTSTNVSRRSSLMSPPSFLSSRSSQLVELVEEAALIFPSNDSPSNTGLGSFGLGGGTSSALRTRSKVGRLSVFEDTGFIADPGFEFDAEGNAVDLPPPADRASIAASATGPASRIESDSAVSAQVRLDHEVGLQGAQSDQQVDLDNGYAFGDDDSPLPEALPFSPTRRLSATRVEEQPRRSLSTRPEEETSSTAEAPQRQRKSRDPKPLQVDLHQELQNADLARWNTYYLANMAEATRVKQQHTSVAQAKKTAAFWVLGQGINGVGIGARHDRVPNPLAVFSGQALLTALTGREFPPPSGTKRTRSASGGLDEGDEENARRVKARGEDEEQVGRDDFGLEDDGMALGDDGIGMFPGEDMDIEVGRRAPESLPGDHSSQMPWNVSASRHGSAGPFGSGLLGGISSSVGGLARGMEFGPASTLLGRRGSRLTSASPLVGRGATAARYSSLEIPGPGYLTSGGADDFDDGVLPLGDDLLDDPEFQLYGPAAAVDTQTAAQSQWVAAALDAEAHNFLAFLAAEIDAKANTAGVGGGGAEGEDEESGTVSFEAILPPHQHSKVVAAQGLLHVLALATKGLIRVQQEEAFGRIEIDLIELRGDEDVQAEAAEG